MFNACDGLSTAWLTRKQEVERIVQQMGGNAVPGLFGPTPGYQGYGSGELQRWKEASVSSSNVVDLLTLLSRS